MPDRILHRDQRQQRLPADPVAEARNSGADPAPFAVPETERGHPVAYVLFSGPLNTVI